MRSPPALKEMTRPLLVHPARRLSLVGLSPGQDELLEEEGLGPRDQPDERDDRGLKDGNNPR